MIAADRDRDDDDELPQSFAEQMEAAGLKPEIDVLQQIIDNFVRSQAEGRASLECGAYR
jgi:hypothetical protein